MDYFSLVLGVKNKVPVIKSMKYTKQSWKIEILKKNNLGRLNEREVIYLSSHICCKDNPSYETL